ncbi:BRO family protein [Maritalea mobilis]|uniref:BRO family protein n=1 Tax=Maritalea mobilis TaxID=483324 RepID=A0A4R6VMZ7_9HYPH|nr:Bro-N domain-containing protein [Maritalea mobilis]TDQ63566.1 BRO family protein [Maritalea mobilis]
MASLHITPATKAGNGLTYNTTEIETLTLDGDLWMTAVGLSAALGCKDRAAVTRIFARYRDEFPPEMSQVVKLTASGNYLRKVRIFSLRGSYLIAMLARTKKAKAFRRWILDLIEKEEAERSNQSPYIIEMAQKSISETSSGIEILNEVWGRKGVATSDHLRSLEKLLHGSLAANQEICLSMRA